MEKNKIVEDLDFFQQIFFDELDSWFSADIVCCECCYNEFIEKWPAIYSRDLDFQCNTIDILSFYSGSRLGYHFSKEEYLYLIEYIRCPRCNSSIGHTLFSYNFPFDIPLDFEDQLEEIDLLAKNTPFLLLSHPLAKKAFDTITNLAKSTASKKINEKYFRARVFMDMDNEGSKKTYTEVDFIAAPKELVAEGRYNHAGFPSLYLANTPTTCFYELREPKEGIAVAEVNVEKPLKILDLLLLEKEGEDESIINMILWSSLMQSPEKGEGWYNPHYTFTRFIADCAKSAGFDAIKYPSVRNTDGYNLVILNGAAINEDIQIYNIRILNGVSCK